jgi:hypothetical protein
MPVENDGVRNVRQVLWRCVDSLATDTGVIQDRLVGPALFLSGLGPGLESLPTEARRELDDIRRSLTKDAKIEAMLKVMTDDEGSNLAKRILSLYMALRGEI